MAFIRNLGFAWFSLAFLTSVSRAQSNYEIQVYPSETVASGDTMVELHSNFTGQGSKQAVDGVLPTDHAVHETLEITHGFNSWFETGVYVFTSARYDQGWQWVGDHIRPRVRAPEEWQWPVGASLSVEGGYQQRRFSPDTWTVELRPILDKQIGRWYFAVNTALGKSLKGVGSAQGWDFSPNAKFGFSINKKVSVGLEYYGDDGPVGDFLSPSKQQHLLIPAIDIDFGKDWEFNFGVGVAMNKSTDSLVIKMILGRRFHSGSQ
jgi:hypothetical protein